MRIGRQPCAAIETQIASLSASPPAAVNSLLMALVAGDLPVAATDVFAALAGHGLLDLAHPHLLTDPGVPLFWPSFCASYDVVAAGYLAVLLLRAGSPARAAQSPQLEG